MEEIIKRFKAQLAKMRIYRHAAGIMHYDMETVMPKGAGSMVGETLGALSEVSYRLQTDPRFLEDTAAILSNPDQVDAITLLEAKKISESRERIACIPVEEYVECQIVETAASNAWHAAKVNNDFASFLPHLEKLVEFTKRFAM